MVFPLEFLWIGLLVGVSAALLATLRELRRADQRLRRLNETMSGLERQQAALQEKAQSINSENALLRTELNASHTEQEILREIGSRLAGSLELRTVYRTVVQKLAVAIDVNHSAIFEYDEPAGVVRALEPRTTQTYRVDELPYISRILRDRLPLIVMIDDPYTEPVEREMMAEEGFAVMLVLAMVSNNRPVGLVRLASTQPRTFSESDIRLAQALTSQAAIAIHNARLFHQVTENRDRLAAILNSTREGVLVIDVTGAITLANPPLEDFWGIPTGRLLNQSLVALLDEPGLEIDQKLGFEREDILELIQTLRAGLALSISKAQYSISQPRLRFLERTGAPVLDQFDKAIGWVIMLRDMTEERELQHVRDALSNMIVHDLRSPLTAVLASASLLRDRIPPEGRTPIVSQAVDIALRSCDRMLKLVNTLLDIARLESHEIQLSMSPVSLNELAEELITELTPLANDQGLVLINYVPPALPKVHVDREKIGRVLANLLDNALKFSPPGGQILVQAEYNPYRHPLDEQPMVTCTVLDSGPGVPEEMRQRIFDRFIQVQGQTGRRAGTGLGLNFCRLMVEAHNGRIWVDSRPEGGSQFRFTLPVEHRPPAGSPSEN